MRKSEAAASTSPSSSSSSSSDANSKHKGSGSSIPDRNTTATIKNNATTTTTTTTTTTFSVSSNGGGGGGNGMNGTPVGNGSNDNKNSVQAAGRDHQHPLLDRQFEVGTAPLATFDTVDLSDEDEMTATTSDVTTTTTTAPTTTTTNTITKSPSFTNNTRRENSPTHTPLPLVTSTNVCTAAGSHEIKTPSSVINTNASVSPSPPTSAVNNNHNNTSRTTITSSLLQKLSPIVSVGKKNDAASSSSSRGATLNPTPNEKKNQEKNSESGRESNNGGGATSPPLQEQKLATANNSAERTGKNLPPLHQHQHQHQHHPNDGGSIIRRSNQNFLPGDADAIKGSDATPDRTRATDPHVLPHSSSSDDEGNASASSPPNFLPNASPASLQKYKPDDAVSVESIHPSIGEGSAVGKEASAAAADITAVVGATAGGASSSHVTPEFANFSNCDELNSNNIGGSHSTASEGGGLGLGPTPAASGSSVPKPKELTTVEKASLLDESSSSDSDLSPTEPANSGGAYTHLASGSTPNLLRKLGREPTGKHKENSAQTTDFNPPEVIHTSSKRKAYERRLQRLQVKTTPINRPRSATPLSVVTLDEYTNLSSPEISPNLEKLKIVLPADQFGRPIKSPRSKENAFDFNEDRLFRHTKEAIVLQSDGSIGQSPRRIFIPPTLSPSRSPCKAAAGSPVSKLVLVSRLPAGTSPLVKSAGPTTVPPLPPPSSSSSCSSPPPLTSPPAPPPPSHPTPTTATTFYSSSSTSSSTSAGASASAAGSTTWKGSDKRWEQFEESHPHGTKPPPQATCSVPKRSEQQQGQHPAAIPDTFDRKTIPPRLDPPPLPGETSSSCLAKGHHREHEKRKTRVSTTTTTTREEPTKPTLDQHHADSKHNNTNTTSALQLHPPPQHNKMLRSNNPEEEEEEQILKVEIGSSDVGKAYNIELEVPARERSDSTYSKSSS